MGKRFNENTANAIRESLSKLGIKANVRRYATSIRVVVPELRDVRRDGVSGVGMYAAPDPKNIRATLCALFNGVGFAGAGGEPVTMSNESIFIYGRRVE